MNKLMMAVAIGGLAVSANAVELSLKSNEDSVVWDSSTLTWIPVGGGELQAYGDCDVAHIGPDFTGSTVTIGGYMGPPELRFNNTQTITLKNGSESGNGFNGKLGVVNKYGTGNLILDFSDWRNYESCDWHVYGGVLQAGLPKWYNGTTGNVNYRFCNNDTITNVTIHVHDGGSLWSPAV